jgi:hypothetical protein
MSGYVSSRDLKLLVFSIMTSGAVDDLTGEKGFQDSVRTASASNAVKDMPATLTAIVDGSWKSSASHWNRRAVVITALEASRVM